MKKISEQIISYMNKKRNYSKEEMIVISYGMELFFSSIIKLLVYMFIGIKPEEKEAIPGLHSPEYQFDDTVLAGAAAAFANIAIHGCMGELKEN